MSRVTDIDLSATMTKAESDERVAKAQRHLTQLRLFSAGLVGRTEPGPGTIVLFEGFDAAGKGGAIRRLSASFDPRHVNVVPVGPPTEVEARHHFLWRFQPHLPGRGEMSIFDRSWYGRLLVERVEGEIDESAVRRSADEIVQFERTLTREGVTLVKFWLHVSPQEQLRRFTQRASSPLTSWKLTSDDWRNREKRDQYLEAFEFIVDACDHEHAHWNLVAGENKHYARVSVLETLVSRWRHDLERQGLEPPSATP